MLSRMSTRREPNYPFKSEHVLNDTASTMATKVRALIGTWNELAVLQPKPSKESLHNLAKFLLSHTLNIVLSVKWMKYRNEYHAPLEQSMKDCMKKYATYPEFQIVCTKLLSLIKGPWSKPEIKHMLSSETIIPTKKEYDFFVYEESAYIISMRLKKLCEDKCGDMALNLTRCYLKCCDWAEEENLSMCISENQKKFVFDIYLSLLFQHAGTVEMSNLLKTMEISEGIEMVRRFAAKVTSKLWENHVNIAKLSGTIFLTRCVMLPFEESSHYLSELLEVWSSVFSQDRDGDEIIASLRRVMKNALTPAHMYLFMDHLSSRFGVTMRPYSVEVCIQAINSDLNCMERAKTENEAETTATRLEAISVRVADGFMRLADQFAENLHVARECVLTAFSIMPTPRIFSKIEEMARASGYEVLDTGQWKCKSHPPPDPAEEVLIKCEQCGEYKSELHLNEALKQATTSLIESFKVNNMGLPSELCDDLVVIIFCARYQMLSWSQTWSDLQRLCVMYLNDPVGTKNLITELKFVEIDYTPFMIKREAEEYVSGDEQLEQMDYIEENFQLTNQKCGKRDRVLSESSCENSDLEDERVPTLKSHLSTDNTENSESSDQQIVENSDKKTDPSVLKALKSFRRKRVENMHEMVKENGRDALASDANDGTSVDAEYEYDTSSSPHSTITAATTAQLLPVSLHHSYAAVPMPHTSSLTGTNSNTHSYNSKQPKVVKRRKCYDPPEKKYKQEFGNFQHDAENYEIDRKRPVGASDGGDGGVCINTSETQPAEPEVDTEKNSHETSSQNLLEFFKRVYNIKECRILLTRCDDLKENRIINKRHNLKIQVKSKLKQLAVVKTSRSVRKTRLFIDHKLKLRPKRRASENVTRSQLEKHFVNFKIPLQLNNNRRILRTSNDADGKMEALKQRLLIGPNKMNPVVVLKRLEDSCMRTLLSRVPGFQDTRLFRPRDTDRIVNVVQVAGGRSTSTVQAPNTQTSTQVSPHIQRIGQPRSEKSDTNTEAPATTTAGKTSTNTYTISKPAGTQSQSTLINILSQQIIRPTNSNNNTRRSGLINIISQPAIKSTANTGNTTVTSDAGVTQLNSTTTRIIATSSEQQQQILNQIVSSNRAGGTVKAVVGTSSSEPGRIVQFICKSTDGKLIPVTSFPSNRLLKVGTATTVTTSDANSNVAVEVAAAKKADESSVAEALPKFQQAFGKSVYQNTNSTDGTNNASATNNTDIADKSKQLTQVKVTASTGTPTATVVSTAINVQPLQGSVIYTRQMPVGQTINLIQQNRGQVFRIATTNADQISLVKDGAIHSKMSALLAAALQGKPKNADTSVVTTGDDASDGAATTTTRVQIARPSLVQNARIVKPVLQMTSNVIRTPQTQAANQQAQTSLSSTTLEQLREFDMVYKQVKERSSTSTPADTSATSSETESSPQRINVTYLNQSQKINCSTPVVVVSSYSSLQPAASPALSVASQGSSSPCVTPAPTPTPVLPKVSGKTAKTSGGSSSTSSSAGKTVKNPPMHAAKTSPIPKPQQKPQEDEHTTQRIFDILAEYAEQLRNSPDLNNKPAPRRRSNPPTNPSQNSKRKKSSSSKKTCGSSLSTEVDMEDNRTVGSEDSSCGVVQLSMQDDDQTPTAASTSESNDSTSHVVTPRAQSHQQLILTEASQHQTRNLIIADSSSVGEALKMPNTAVLVPGNYIMPVSMVKGGQQIAVMSGGSKILATVPARSGPNMLLFQSFLNQNRKPGIATTASTVKYSTIQPISGITSHTISGVSAQPPVILPPPTVTLGQPIAIKKLDDSSEQQQQQLLLTISHPARDVNCTNVDAEGVSQPDSSTSIGGKLDLDENTAMSSSDSSSEKAYVFQKQATPIATPVIAQAIKDEIKGEAEPQETIMTLDINNPTFSKVESHTTPKNEERVQSVLVTAGTSNGPMLSHSPPQYKQSDCSNGNEQNKDEFLRNGGKRSDKVQSTVFCVQGKVKKTIGSRMDREVQQMCMQRRQAAIERELRLQKSLSEECEDLGVDEPSTSDLFPEALLFDSNNSPSFDQTSQDNLKRSQIAEKEENKLSLFSDDDFIFETSHYDEGNDTQLCYEEVVDSRILSNGQGGTAEDTTLLQTCTSMSDVTLSSPISPDNFRATTSPPLNKYMHKYTNKKKNEKHEVVKQVDAVDTWSAEVSSSEDTMGSTDCKHDDNDDLDADADDHHDVSEDDLSSINAGSFKVVRINVGKTECNEVHCFAEEEIELDGSISGRGARRTIKKKCSCCNGAEETSTLNLNVNANTHGTPNANTNASVNHSATRKRVATTTPQHAASPHKKAFPNKKR
ncbi:uncharacterized protein [Atheta coriaria]|uniref:uncharacterized protein isoform X3 n=1 Tax=Dalotia coriaria TaxID=877792 RepID=UPI0031F414EB